MNSADKRISQISVVIPTLNRGQVLLDTLAALLDLEVRPAEIIVVDQTLDHPTTVSEKLAALDQDGNISWLKATIPSVVKAMNRGLLAANFDHVLFLDDDIKPFPKLLETYQALISTHAHQLVAGRVVQPWDDTHGIDAQTLQTFSFNALGSRPAEFFIGANFLVETKKALAIGGFDENFKGASHDYEREFSDRMLLSGGSVFYCGDAAVHHLKEQTGGIRSFGHFLKTVKPHHSVGAFYYIFRSQRVNNKLTHLLQAIRERTITRVHLREPWWIPFSIIGNALGVVWAGYLYFKGPDLITK